MDTRETQRQMTQIQNSEQIQELFGKLVSRKIGYKAVIEVNKPLQKCSCGKVLEGEEKFCPECGNKIEK